MEKLEFDDGSVGNLREAFFYLSSLVMFLQKKKGEVPRPKRVRNALVALDTMLLEMPFLNVEAHKDQDLRQAAVLFRQGNTSEAMDLFLKHYGEVGNGEKG